MKRILIVSFGMILISGGCKKPAEDKLPSATQEGANKVQTTGCTVANPITYNLKELFIINQGEIR
jgi:hypothetical protein